MKGAMRKYTTGVHTSRRTEVLQQNSCSPGTSQNKTVPGSKRGIATVLRNPLLGSRLRTRDVNLYTEN